MNICKGMLCPVCETGAIEPRDEDLEFEYKGRKTVFSRKTVFRCPECEESFLAPHDEQEIEKYLTDERRKADGLLTSEEIRAVRDQFQMTRAEFAGMLRLSEKNFARYEDGQSAQDYATDDLLRILREFPEILRTVSFPSLSDMNIPEINTAEEPAAL
jgi:HTH-type transcriptional regulator/antitoxin MqsA